VGNSVVTCKIWLQQRYGENAGQLLDSNEASLLKAASSATVFVLHVIYYMAVPDEIH
jgi:hypothetical protein